jgi:hypothetical protein
MVSNQVYILMLRLLGYPYVPSSRLQLIIRNLFFIIRKVLGVRKIAFMKNELRKKLKERMHSNMGI